jgi:hypothetical protein
MKNYRNGAAVAARSLIVAVGLTLSINALTHGQTVATWTGAGGNRNWSNPANWSGGIVPNNTPTQQFAVVIPGTASVFVDAASPQSISLASMNLALGATIQVSTQRTVSVASNAGIFGNVQMDSIGSFFANSPAGSGPSVLTPNAIVARAAGRFQSNATSIDISRPTPFIGSGPGISASEAAAVVDLASVTSLTFGTTGTGGAQQVGAIAGTVDLSRLEMLTRVGSSSTLEFRAILGGVMRLNALRHAEGVNFIVSNSTMNLGSLTSARAGRIEIGGSTVSLTSLTDIRGTAISLFNATVTAPNLMLIDGATFSVGGGSFIIPATVTSYVAAPSAVSTAFDVSTGGTLGATGLRTMDFTTPGVPRPRFNATGGVLNLPALTTIGRAATTPIELIASSNGSINLESLTSLDNATVELSSGATVNLAGLTSSAGSRFVLTGGSSSSMPLLRSVNNSTFWTDGATLALPSVVSYQLALNIETAGLTPFRAAGANSVIDLSNLETLSLQTQRSAFELGIISTGQSSVVNLPTLHTITRPRDTTTTLLVSATDGGRVNLPRLASMGDNARLTVTGASSALDLRALETLSGGTVRVTQGATALFDSLRGIADSSIVFENAGNGFGANVSSFEGSTLFITGGNVSMPLLQTASLDRRPQGPNVHGAGIGGVLDWGNLRTLWIRNSGISQTQGGPLRIEALGGLVNLNSLTTINFARDTENQATRPLVFSALGGRVNLNALRSMPNVQDVSFSIAGPTAVIDAPLLEFIGGPVDRGLQLTMEASQGGVLTLPALARAMYSNLRVTSTGAGSVVRLPVLGGSRSFSSLTVAAGGRIELPAIDSLSRATISVDGAGSSITLGPGTIVQNPGITVTNGGVFTVPQSEQMSRFRSLSVSGANSRITIPNLRTFTYGSENEPFPTVSADGGVIDLGELTTFSGISIGTSVRFGAGTGGTVVANALTTFSGAVDLAARGGNSLISMNGLTTLASAASFRAIAANGGRIELAGLTSIGGTATREFSIETGSTLTLPSLTSLGSSSNTTFIAGTGSSVLLPALSNPTTAGLFRLSASGGVVRAPMITTFAGVREVQLVQGGTASQLDLPNLQTFGTAGTRSVSADAGSTLSLPALTDMRNVDVTLRDNSRLLTPNVTTIDGSTFQAANASYTTPASITRYSAESRLAATLLFANEGGTLNADALQVLQIGNNSTAGVVHSLIARSNSVLSLAGLRAIESTNSGVLSVVVSGSGTIRFNSLQQFSEANLEIQDGGSILTPALTAADSISVAAINGGTWAMPANITTYASGTRLSSTIFSSNVTGSSLNLSSLTSIGAGNPEIAGQIMSIDGLSSGVVNLSGLTDVQSVNGGRLRLNVSQRGVINASSLTTLRNVDIRFSGPDPVIQLGTITSIDSGSITASDTNFSLAALLPGIATYSALDRGPSVILSGTSGSAGEPIPQVVDFSPITSLTIGSSIAPGVVHTISAGRGTVNLFGLTSFNRVNDGRLGLVASNTGILSIPNLTSNLDGVAISVATGGRLLAPAITSFNGSTIALNGATTQAPALNFASYNTGTLGSSTIIDLTGRNLALPNLQSIAFGNATTPNAAFVIRAANGELALPSLRTLQSVNGGTLQFQLEGTGRLVTPSLTITNDTRLQTLATGNNRPTVQLSGPLQITTTDTANFIARTGTFSFQGVPSTTVEVAGRNLGIVPITTIDTLTNFAMGQLVLGTATTPTNVLLVDLFNNGNRGPLGQPEALYLTGGSATAANAPATGLILNAGSRLTLSDGIDVYFRTQGQPGFSSLRSLFQPGQTTIAFGGGFVTIPSPGAAITLALAGLVATRRRRA